jgi:hypothetical protein
MITVGSIWELKNYNPHPLVVIVTGVGDRVVYIRWIESSQHRECGEPLEIFEKYYTEVI